MTQDYDGSNITARSSNQVYCFNCCARSCNNQWETPINRERCTREIPKRQEQINKRESQTQYLTRFDNLSTSSGQEERSYWFNNQLQVTVLGRYIFLFITKEFLSFRKSQLDSTPDQNQSSNPDRTSKSDCRSIAPVNWLFLQSTGRSTEP